MTLAAEAMKLDVPVLIGVFGAALVIVLAFAAATGWVGKVGEQPDAEPEELEPVVAGIGVGSAGVPKWLYAAYAIIPLWAMFFLVSNTEVDKEKVPEPGQAASPSPGAGGAAATAAPGGPVSITAKDVVFDKKTFALKAGTPFTIRFRNNDTGIDHNVAIANDEAFTSVVFSGEIFKGTATREYKVPALAAGTYYFRCDVHTGMKGTATVS